MLAHGLKTLLKKQVLPVEGFKNKFSSIGNTIGSIAGKIGGFCKEYSRYF